MSVLGYYLPCVKPPKKTYKFEDVKNKYETIMNNKNLDNLDKQDIYDELERFKIYNFKGRDTIDLYDYDNIHALLSIILPIFIGIVVGLSYYNIITSIITITLMFIAFIQIIRHIWIMSPIYSTLNEKSIIKKLNLHVNLDC